MPLLGRRDGAVVKDVPAYRRIMPLIMRGRNESCVYFEQKLDAQPALEFVHRWNAAHPDRKITFFHLLTHEVVKLLHERPRLNRFVSGGRLYQRHGIWISYSAKKSMSDDAPIVALKQRFDPAESLPKHIEQLLGGVREGRSDKQNTVDKELALLFKLPLFLVSFLVRVAMKLDQWNLLPFAMIKHDPLYSSVFIANLGSIKLDAAFHHTYEYGNIPVFCVVGRVEDAVVALPDGSVTTRKQITLKWTLDERVEDGLYCARTLDTLKQRLESPRDESGITRRSAEAA